MYSTHGIPPVWRAVRVRVPVEASNLREHLTEAMEAVALSTQDGPRDDLAELVAAIAAVGRLTDERSLLVTLAELAAAMCRSDAAAVVARTTDLGGWETIAHTGDIGLAPEMVATLVDRIDAPEAGLDQPGDLVTASAGVLVALLRTPRDRIGAIVVTPPPGGFDHRHHLLLDGLARRSGVAIDAIRHRTSLDHELRLRQQALDERDEIVRILQRSLLPSTLPTIGGLDIAAAYRPMVHGIGGDFYDVFALRDGGWGVVVGDVCGKGPTAAAVTALGRHGVRTASMAHDDPSRVLEVVNQLLVQQREEDRSTLVTAVFVHIVRHDHGARLTAAVAGHPSPIVLRDDGTVETFPPTGPLLGLFDDPSIGELRIDLDRGDTCVLYTDGATDIRGPGGVFGEERLLDVVAGCRGMHAEAIVKSIERAVVDYQDGDITDDLAVLGIAVPATG